MKNQTIFIPVVNCAIEFNIPTFENPENQLNYISLLKQLGYSQEDLDHIISKMPTKPKKKEGR
jgi:hypothetical protein